MVDQPVDIFYIDPSSVFQNFVSENMKAEYYEKLKDNGIYRQISQNLRETHNFAALYKTEKIISSGEYDLVVLDTPPSHQVVDFFESPAQLQRFFSATAIADKKGWLHWVQEKGIQVAEGFLKTLVGDEFVGEMDHFFRFVGDIKNQIFATSEGFLEHMRGPQSSLQLVFPPAKDKIQDALYLNQAISKNNFAIDGYILNRAYPNGLDFSEELSSAADEREKKLYHYFKSQKTKSEDLVDELRRGQLKNHSTFVRLPEFRQAIEQIEDVYLFSELVNTHWEVLSQ